MSTTSSPIDSEILADGTAVLTLNRPQIHNAFNDEMIMSLSTALTALEKNAKVKFLILRSVGENFSAGADLNWMKKLANASAAENLQDAKKFATLLSQLFAFKKPTIALVQGKALGGAIGLIACCDLVIASNDATFCFPEVKLGLIPAVISPYVVNAIGIRQTKAYFLTAQPFSAQQALALGLCHEVVAANQLPSRGAYWVEKLGYNSPHAMQEVKSFLAPFYAPLCSAEWDEVTAEKIASLRASDEGQEGLKAFLEKRPPFWQKSI